MTSDPAAAAFAYQVHTTGHHSAAAFGNDGVTVVGTPALIGFLETAAAQCALGMLGAGEVTVGTMVHVHHHAAAPAGAIIDVRAELVRRDGRRLSFAVTLQWGALLLMSGTHERAIVALRHFLARLPTAPP